MEGITRLWRRAGAGPRRFAVAPGRVHAVLGENGAGKSTLIKVMSGVVIDEGRMWLEDRATAFACRRPPTGPGSSASSRSCR
ncbi:MAG: ATP-binding cassette domain-containing protein [Geminicoccaceae bacterium]